MIHHTCEYYLTFLSVTYLALVKPVHFLNRNEFTKWMKMTQCGHVYYKVTAQIH